LWFQNDKCAEGLRSHFSKPHKPSEEVKRKTVENNGLKFLCTSVEMQYREMGMRSIIWEGHKNKASDSLVQM
jgi:hypothetical protein